MYLVRTSYITPPVVLSQAISGGQDINDLNLDYLYCTLMFSKPIHKSVASRNSYQERESPNGKAHRLRYKIQSKKL